jgi:hypothetical protein
MRALIIDEKEVCHLFERMKLAEFEMKVLSNDEFGSTFWKEHEHAIRHLIERVHGRFQFVVKEWLRSQGAQV